MAFLSLNLARAMDIQIDLIVVDDAQAQNRTKLRKRDTRRQNQQRRRHHHKPKGRNRRSHFQNPSQEKYKYLTDDMRQSLLSRLYELATEDIGFSYWLFDSDSKFLHLSCKERRTENRSPEENYLKRSIRGSKMARDYTNINHGLNHVV